MSLRLRIDVNLEKMGYGNAPWQAWPCVTLTPGATVYGFSISLNTINTVRNAKTHSIKQWNSPRYDRSQNPLISSDHDLTYDVITSWSKISGQNFQNVSNWLCRGYCKFCCDQMLFTRVIYEKPWGPFDPPTSSREFGEWPVHFGVCHIPWPTRSKVKKLFATPWLFFSGICGRILGETASMSYEIRIDLKGDELNKSGNLRPPTCEIAPSSRFQWHKCVNETENGADAHQHECSMFI